MTTEPDPAAPTGSGPGSDPPASADSPPSPTSVPPPPAAPWRPAAPPPATPSWGNGGAVLGAILIGLGLLFLAGRFLDVNLGHYGWPLFIVVPGALLFLAGFAAPPREGAGLAIAGGIVTMVGLVLAVQSATDTWASWAYAWTLVALGGSGLGMTLYGLIRGMPDLVSSGARLLGIGIALFVGLGLFFEGVLGLSGDPFLVGSDYLPVVLIAIGAVLLLWGLVRGRRIA